MALLVEGIGAAFCETGCATSFPLHQRNFSTGASKDCAVWPGFAVTALRNNLSVAQLGRFMLPLGRHGRESIAKVEGF